MIVLDLECARGHRFEGWFGSTTAFEHQLAHGLISCPSCGANTISRRPSAPYVQTPAAAARTPLAAPSGGNTLSELTDTLLAHLRNEARGMEDVGKRFAEEARRIHHGDAKPRGIRGQASREEVHDLLDEGIPVLPVPPEEDIH